MPKTLVSSKHGIIQTSMAASTSAFKDRKQMIRLEDESDKDREKKEMFDLI
jgi:hypothetical protein